MGTFRPRTIMSLLCSYKNNRIETIISLLFKDLINNKAFFQKLKIK